jgi:acyl-CoA dehydrogenase
VRIDHEALDLAPGTAELHRRMVTFMRDQVLPAEEIFAAQQTEMDDIWEEPPIVDALREQARAAGLWNLFLNHPVLGTGLSNEQYAPLAEITGWSPFLAPEALNCAAPDSGNIELLAAAGTAEQRQRWLAPLLAGTIRSAFAMTEPDVASSDAANIATRIERHNDEYVINGRKWFTSGVLSPRCRLMLVLGVTDPHGPRGGRHSIILVPPDAPGVHRRRALTVLGYRDGPSGGHAEVGLDAVRVPADSLLGQEGEGLALAQLRLAGGRIHHCMRLVGMAERALELLCRRSLTRTAFGAPLADQGTVQRAIAESRGAIDQARLLVRQTARLVDRHGPQRTRAQVSVIKAVVPTMTAQVVDRAIQVHGAAGLSQDLPLAQMYTFSRVLRIADGPDEVHHRVIARHELRRHTEGAGGTPGPSPTAADFRSTPEQDPA